MSLKINVLGKYQRLNGVNLNQILRSVRVQQPFIPKAILQRKWKYLGHVVSEARVFATADMLLGNWKKYVKGDDSNNHSSEHVEEKKIFVIYEHKQQAREKENSWDFFLPI